MLKIKLLGQIIEVNAENVDEAVYVINSHVDRVNDMFFKNSVTGINYVYTKNGRLCVVTKPLQHILSQRQAADLFEVFFGFKA